MDIKEIVKECTDIEFIQDMVFVELGIDVSFNAIKTLKDTFDFNKSVEDMKESLISYTKYYRNLYPLIGGNNGPILR